jgi:hypothetical protein
MMRLLPMFLILFAIYKGQAQAKPLLHLIERFTTEVEVSNMIQFMEADALEGDFPTPESFESYLRKNNKSKLPGRDPSVDYWGTPYRLELHDHIITITSAGPDKQFGTGDDVRGSFRKKH